MRILLHDYGRFPFIFQLAGSLARRGHEVQYICSGAVPARSSLAVDPALADRLQTVTVPLDKPLAKDQFLRRRNQEIQHGHAVEKPFDAFKPDVVVSANTPLDAQAILQKTCQRKGVPFVYWLQDVQGIAINEILKRRLPALGPIVGSHYVRLERELLCQSDQVVIITDSFRSIVREMGVEDAKVHVIENWAPLDEHPTRPKDNEWARLHGLENRKVILYSGTMGMKHDPSLLLELAAHLRRIPEACLVIVSNDSALSVLDQERQIHKLDNLILLPFQAYEDLPNVLASSDVLIAVLETAAGVFSVPSKVLTYLCAGRALLLAVNKDNLAAEIVSGSGAGLVVPPTDPKALKAAACDLLSDDETRAEMGRNARAYAERTFAIETVTDKFLKILER